VASRRSSSALKARVSASSVSASFPVIGVQQSFRSGEPLSAAAGSRESD
jgi:hypothetical protein